MKKFRELSEAIKDKYDIGEYDQEGDMAKSDLRSIIANSKRVHDMLKDDDNLPEWVQSKITKAEDYMSTVANYLESEMNEEVGASKKQETTFHKKLDTLVHKTFGKRKEEMKEAKETGFEKTFRKNTGETYDQYANRRAKEEDERQEKMKKQKEDYIKQGIIKAEEVEELDEVSADVAKRVAQARDRSAVANKLTPTQSRRTKMGDKGGDPDINAGKALKSAMKRGAKNVYGEEVEELDEALRHEIAGQVGRFIGNKIDPVHGDIMHAHGKEAYRQAAYHIRKTVKDVSQAVSDLHDRLHRHLRTGTLTTEDVEIDEARYPGFRPGLGLGKRGAPSQRDNYKDFNDGRPFGFTPIKDKKPEEPKKMKEEAELLDEKNEPTNPELWSRAKALAKSKFDVYPSAYANGWASKWYKSKGGGWRSVSEEVEELDENMMKKLAAAGIAASLAASPAAQARVTPGGQSVAQQAVATQKAPEQKKASVPSKSYLQTVASGKSRSIMHPDTAKELLKKHYSEETDLDEGYFKNQEIERQETERLAKRNELPFTPDKPKKRSVVVGKKPEGYSRVRQLARQAMQKYTTPVKEEKDMSKKAKIVKDAMKKSPDDKFQANPELSNSVTRNL
jgi:hypothetical protein